MYIVGAIILSGILLWAARSGNNQDRAEYDLTRNSEDRLWLLLLHARQELKIIVFLLAGVIVMLGVVAERIGPA